MRQVKVTDGLLLGLICLISCSAYLLYSNQYTGFGFPLDDGWIHQTFARNFAQDLSWSFQSGELSGGSTGPGWGLLLSVVYWLRIPPVIGTYMLGYMILLGSSIAAYVLVSRILPGNRVAGLGAGILISLEWHLVWSTLSGMETQLLILISLAVFCLLFQENISWWVVGTLIGIAIWIRPDGITLIGPALMLMVLRHRKWPQTLQAALQLIAGPIFFTGMYFLFNLQVASQIWPNTFFAKQAEYSILRVDPIWIRFWNVSKQTVTGVGALLLPAALYQGWKAIQAKRWEFVAALIWSVGYLLIYAWRLPVVYQHGRYIHPVLPISYLVGWVGLLGILHVARERLWSRVFTRAWLASASLVLISFWLLGARAFALDVAVINSEMVRTAQWVEKNLDSDAVVAAHDIGALGYFGNREIIDLAGLITPDVIPFIRDEAQLDLYISDRGADYLVTFPGWYPKLTANRNEIYNTGGEYSPLFGAENMAVFEWR